MGALRAMYGLRRVPMPVTGLLLSASTVHLLNIPTEQASANLSQAMHDFRAMSTNHYFAGNCIDIIRELATKWNIQLPESVPSSSPFKLGSHLTIPPPQSAFYAPSIPRQISSGNSGAVSAESNSTLQESPFSPPPGPPSRQQSHQQQEVHQIQQQQQSVSPYDDPFANMDPNQIQEAFWVPFPLQGMPHIHYGDEHANGINFHDSSSSHWQHYNLPYVNSGQHHSQQQHAQHGTQHLQPQQDHRPSQDAASGKGDTHMSEETAGWDWQ
jgi:hypothetical protein